MSASALVPLLVTLPLLGAAIALIAGRHRKTQVAVSVVTLTLVLAIAAVLLVRRRHRRRADRGVGRRLADPVRHRAVRRSARRAAGRGLEHRAARGAALLGRPGRGRRRRRHTGLDLPPVVPDPRGGHLHRVHRRRPVQPLRRLRDPARRVVRADHPRQHRVAHPHRRRLHRRLARVVDPVPRRDRRDLRGARHREHGADLRADDRASAGDADRPARHAAARVQHQGRRLPAVVLAARLATRPRPHRSRRCSRAC